MSNSNPDINKVANVIIRYKGQTKNILLAALCYHPYRAPLPPMERDIYKSNWVATAQELTKSRKKFILKQLLKQSIHEQ